ncbi:SixA phosphatase family protein [Leifsonia flava]|uniref:Histidine phosphatase family protein n=1 Tax=Orlajensenia leifsoniae TaxID=2561933 RepID=A0A4Y9QU88_9MICO|nr:histidine phosphatase family protein [Leifsonia flava]TFV95308.1 histidine phosphatase family protein [Leifsonia flava]
MKTLVIVRHAKSDWDDPDLSDHQRPLNDRGQRDAPRMGRRMQERGLAPDVVFSSSAVRALTTATIIADELGYARDRIRVLDRLYGASPATMLDVVAELDETDAAADASSSTVVVVAHDPGMSDLAAHFTMDRGAEAIAAMPTCAVAEFTFDADRWTGLAERRPMEVRFDSPGHGHGHGH